MTMARIAAAALYTVFLNYLLTLIVVAILGSNLAREILPNNNAFPLYAVLFPFTFIILSTYMLKNRKE